MKLVRAGTANRSGIGRNRAKSQSEPREYPRVGVVHISVLAIKVGMARVKRVTVLHHKFASAHNTEAGAPLIAELRLNLVEVDRQLAVAFDFATRNIGDHFLGGGLDYEVAL